MTHWPRFILAYAVGTGLGMGASFLLLNLILSEAGPYAFYAFLNPGFSFTVAVVCALVLTVSNALTYRWFNVFRFNKSDYAPVAFGWLISIGFAGGVGLLLSKSMRGSAIWIAVLVLLGCGTFVMRYRLRAR